MPETTIVEKVEPRNPPELPENPFTVASPTPTLPTRKAVMHDSRRRSVFLRILITFFLLSVTPIAISAGLTATVYQSSIRQFLPATSVDQVEQVLLAQNILILILVVIMVIFAGSLISASLVRPLNRLVKLTHLVGEGELRYRLKATSRDEISELTEAFNIMVDRLEEQRRRERLISQMKSEFISIAAHQLRTPLSAVKWTLRMLEEGDIGPLSEEQREFIERGYRVNERMIRLVGDLLNVARIEEGRFGYERIATDFLAYLSQTVEKFRVEAAAQGVGLSYEKPNFTLPKLLIDPAKMELAIQNIIENAIKYSQPGGLINVGVTRKTDKIEVTIEDHGVGIPEHQMHRLFTKFFRADNVVRMQTEGSGLGLFIVKNIIKNHGGDIRAESKEGQGTKMIFNLPLSATAIPQKETTFEEFVGGL
ncbi:MAG: HAMP domain-containing sensor histidine kinase [Patescibacteria group bacterium]|jgi:signal transduction histidine kinase